MEQISEQAKRPLPVDLEKTYLCPRALKCGNRFEELFPGEAH